MRKIQKLITPLLYVCALFLCACNSTPEDAKKSAEEKVEALGKITVSLDSVQGGSISLTKNFYFLFDGSGSMGESCSEKTKIDGAKEAAIKFLEKLPENSNIGLLVFGTKTEGECTEELPLTLNGKEQFKAAINRIQPSEGTPLGEAITIGTQKLVEQYKKQLGYGEYRLIVVTDGECNGAMDMTDACITMSRYEFIAMYSIGLCLDKTHDLKSFAISYRDANNYDDLQKALEQSVAEIQSYDAGAYDSTAYTKQTIKK